MTRVFKAVVICSCLNACVVPIVAPVPVPGNVVAGQARVLAVNSASDSGFHRAINAQRQRHGRSPLTSNDALTAAAQSHADDMAQRGYFAHQSPDGQRASDRAAQHGVPSCGIGENIAMGQKTSDEAVASWMASPGHRANMLNPAMRSYGLGQAGDIWVLMLYQPC